MWVPVIAASWPALGVWSHWLPVHQARALRKKGELGCFLCSTSPDLLCTIRYQVDGSLFCVPLALLVRKDISWLEIIEDLPCTPKTCVVACACYPNTQEVEAEVQGHPWLPSKLRLAWAT